MAISVNSLKPHRNLGEVSINHGSELMNLCEHQ